MHWFGDEDTGFISALNDAADWVGGAINDVQDFFTKDLTPHDITEFAEATAMLTNAVNEGTNSYSVYGDEAVQFLNDMADATEAANASGKNMELVNSTLAELASVGVSIRATDLPAYLRGIASTARNGTGNLEAMAATVNGFTEQLAKANIEGSEFSGIVHQQQNSVAWANYARTAEELRNAGRELSDAEKEYLAAYDSYMEARNSLSAENKPEWLRENPSVSAPDREYQSYAKQSIDEALEWLAMVTRLSEQMGSTESALEEMASWESGDTVGTYFKPEYLAAWQREYEALSSLLAGGTSLTEEQAAFMKEYDALMDFFGEDFLSGIDLTENGIEIGGSLGEGIENRLKAYDFSGTGSAVADSLENAVRAPLGAHSPAARFIPIGLDIAEGLAAGIASGTSLVTGAIVALANATVAAARDALQIRSPSRVFRDEVGAMAMAGFGEGVTDQTKAQGKIIRNAARYLTDEARWGIASGYAQTTNNYTTNAPVSFDGATFSIREEQDAYALAQEIASLIKRQQAGKGFRR